MGRFLIAAALGVFGAIAGCGEDPVSPPTEFPKVGERWKEVEALEARARVAADELKRAGEERKQREEDEATRRAEEERKQAEGKRRAACAAIADELLKPLSVEDYLDRRGLMTSLQPAYLEWLLGPGGWSDEDLRLLDARRTLVATTTRAASSAARLAEVSPTREHLDAVADASGRAAEEGEALEEIAKLLREGKPAEAKAFMIKWNGHLPSDSPGAEAPGGKTEPSRDK